jgi:hypothetical protein
MLKIPPGHAAWTEVSLAGKGVPLIALSDTRRSVCGGPGCPPKDR